MDPEAVMRMPYARFLAWQRLAFRRDVERRNARLNHDAAAKLNEGSAG